MTQMIQLWSFHPPFFLLYLQIVIPNSNWQLSSHEWNESSGSHGIHGQNGKNTFWLWSVSYHLILSCSIALTRSPLNKDFRDHAEQQHIAAQQKAALQVSWYSQGSAWLCFRCASLQRAALLIEILKSTFQRLGISHFCICHKWSIFCYDETCSWPWSAPPSPSLCLCWTPSSLYLRLSSDSYPWPTGHAVAAAAHCASWPWSLQGNTAG